VIGEASRLYARDVVDITGQQRFQLRRIRDKDVAKVTAWLQVAGLDSAYAWGSPRGIFLGSPVAGIAADEIIDGTPALQEIRGQRAVREEFSALRRPFRTAVSGSPRQDVLHEACDVSFLGVRHPELGLGFDVRVGTGLLAGPASAGRLGAFVTLREVPTVWSAIVAAFRDHGYGRPGGHDRLASLVADWGADEFRRVIEAEYLHRSLCDGPAPPPAGPRDHIGVHPQRDGQCYVGTTPATARATGATLVALADLAEAHGSYRVCTTPYQKLIVLDIAPDRVESLCDGLERIGLTARPCLFRRRELIRDRACVTR
jgi:sulfite reductase (ferredoxin)